MDSWPQCACHILFNQCHFCLSIQFIFDIVHVCPASPSQAPSPPPQLTHRQLAMFRAIMLHSNLGRAADATGSSQPTLSRELARLEQVLGFALFDRVGGRLRPTVRGAGADARGGALLHRTGPDCPARRGAAHRQQRTTASGLPARAGACAAAPSSGALSYLAPPGPRQRRAAGVALAGAGPERAAL